jgi:hypothetical protein
MAVSRRTINSIEKERDTPSLPLAIALAGLVLSLAILGCWLVKLAKGHDGSPPGQRAAVGGLAYIAGVALLRWRS